MNAKIFLFAALAMPLLMACEKKETTPAMPSSGSPQTTAPAPATQQPPYTPAPTTSSPPSSTDGAATTGEQGTK
ncbi:hypothetical protein [Aromatoleum diolicum]|uniref:Endopeptidase n=1 Tax=Aromatoleum diolicum TaxID=75796 RepID=A0ABX1QAY4_9RHOO|nr:hypothetical protein [Aromatoleum diolicum]NMG74675.1 hypothetical protein [Aromatoleum diolicum]